MEDFPNENVLEHAIEAFHETIALNVRQLRRYVPKQEASTNPELTGACIEGLVRGFVRGRLGDKRLLHGTFYSKAHVESGEKPMQIDGIVHVPSRGPLVIQEGDFAIVHPAFAAGVIEIKRMVSSVADFESRLQTIYARYLGHRIVVLTQTCDLANQKTQRITVAVVHGAQWLVDQGIVKAADVRGLIRAGRVFGWYFLPSRPEWELSESVVDLRQLHTVPREVLETLCATRGRLARIQPLYREHSSKHFADTFSRIGLPEPYQTE